MRRLFPSALGGVYLVAFRSLSSQVRGLYGRHGILPVHELLETASSQLGRERYHYFPTALWLGDSDRQLVRLCRAGEVLSAMMLCGFLPRLSSALAWALYLSMVSVGRDFLSFQWDTLLLETGLLEALGAPRICYRWLLFRLYFESGLAKLQSHDPTWRTGRALRYYYETAPLPTRLGWWAHQLPPSVQGYSTAGAVAFELGVPFLLFAPRRLRQVALGALTGLQVAFAATGNYGFFNLLTGALGLALVDPPRRRSRLARAIGWAAALPLLALSAGQLLQRIGILKRRPRRLERVLRETAPFHPVSPYGLFAVMTVQRPEIIIEGSNDGIAWRSYEFRWKVGDPRRAPRWVAPHQPRLDWQMWFAALDGIPGWFVRFLTRLLEGSPDVLSLLANNPFPDGPPRYVRATLYEYKMTDRATRRATGAWWRRERIGTYFPPVSRSVD